MKSQSRWLSSALATALLVCTAAPGVALAQTYGQLHSFTPSEGRQVTGRLLQRPDGRLIGTANYGGAFSRGTVYELDPSTNAVTILHSFVGKPKDGAVPVAGITIGPDGNLWGVTREGGKANGGTVYRISRSGHLRIMHMFGKDIGGGRGPVGTLILASDGLMYGTTVGGGPNGFGTVYRVDSGGTVRMLWFMDGAGQPRSPQGRLLEGSDGMLYGTSSFGGTHDKGTVFRLAKDGSSQEVLHSFATTDGFDGWGGVTEGSDGRLYGTTSLGGSADGGVAFRLDRDGANFEVLHSFARDRVDGTGPFGELLETSPGVFMGTTVTGGANDKGTIYQMLDSGEVTVLYSFTGAMTPEGYVDGSIPVAMLTPLADGTLLGVTQTGGADGMGTIYKLSTP